MADPSERNWDVGKHGFQRIRDWRSITQLEERITAEDVRQIFGS
jgi:hypothetical protein